jgi:predicted dehydrogenase
MEPLRVAIVGFGSVAESVHLPAYLGAPFRIAAIADVCEARRAVARALLPNVRIYADHRALLAQETRSLDILDIATPTCDHATIAHAGLRAGLHVLCERPLAMSLDDATALLAAARRASRVIHPCADHDNVGAMRVVRRALDEGRIGELRVATLQTFRAEHARGAHEWRPDWRRERQLAGGGVAMDQGGRTFRLAMDWMGESPRSISATSSTVGDWDTEDNLSCTMTFPGGRMASAHLTWTAGINRVVYTLHGTEGAIRVEDDHIEIASPVEHTRRTMPSSSPDGFRRVLDRFAHAIAHGDFAGPDAEEAVRCLELVEAAYRSVDASSLEIRLAHTSGDRASGVLLTRRDTLPNVQPRGSK